MARTIIASDLFCGAGGTSTGIINACKRRSVGIDLLAINHWPTAVNTHILNHPSVRHLCENLDSVDPRKEVTGDLDLLAASPECTHHSNARGGVPCSDQSRATAWHVLRWMDAKLPRVVMIENVREFINWGPLNANGRPNKVRKGELFNSFIMSIAALGYTVDWRVLNAADYGDATTRQRLIVMARRGNKPIVWPEPTHSAKPFGKYKRWRPARDIIDWSLKGKSIFDRKRPLSPNTMKRIEAGLKKFGGGAFVIAMEHADKPLPAVTTADAFGVAEPFLVKLYGTSKGGVSVDKPCPTVTSGGGHIGLCEPFLVGAGGPSGAAKPKSVNEPLNTVLAENRIGLVEPFIVSAGGPNVDARPVSKPLNTVLCRDHLALCEPFLFNVNHGEGDSGRHQTVDEPLKTVTCKNGIGLAEPFVVKYYGTGVSKPVSEPLDTVTTKDRLLLVMPDGTNARLDVRFRMLQPHELAAAMGFPDDYVFEGNRAEQVKQIGNAVCVNLADALATAHLKALGL